MRLDVTGFFLDEEEIMQYFNIAKSAFRQLGKYRKEKDTKFAPVWLIELDMHQDMNLMLHTRKEQNHRHVSLRLQTICWSNCLEKSGKLCKKWFIYTRPTEVTGIRLFTPRGY